MFSKLQAIGIGIGAAALIVLMETIVIALDPTASFSLFLTEPAFFLSPPLIGGAVSTTLCCVRPCFNRSVTSVAAPPVELREVLVSSEDSTPDPRPGNLPTFSALSSPSPESLTPSPGIALAPLAQTLKSADERIRASVTDTARETDPSSSSVGPAPLLLSGGSSAVVGSGMSPANATINLETGIVTSERPRLLPDL